MVQLTAGVTLSGLLLLLAKLRKLKVVRFVSDAGIPQLTIARTKIDAAKFDEFVALLIEQIHRARVGTKPTSAPD